MIKAYATLAAVAVALTVCMTSSGATAKRTFDIVVPGTKSTHVDLGAKGDSPGDYYLATGLVLDKVGGKRIGGLAGVWTLVSPAADKASMTISLQKGSIYVDGQIHHAAKTSVLRVAGGTGAFRDARGKAVFRYLTETSASLHFELS